MSIVQNFTGTAYEWDAFVDAHPNSTSSHLFGWRRVIERVYAHDCPYLAMRQGSTLTGILPLIDVRSLAFGRYLVSMPYLNAGGPLGDSDTVLALAQAANLLAQERHARLLELRCTQPIFERAHSAEKVSCVLSLPGDPQVLWKAFPGKLRSQIRRPEKEGVEVRFGPDQLEPFFRVFSRNMRDLGSPPHPRSFFQAARAEFGEQVWFGCAYLGGQPVAAGCGLAWRNEVELTWASSLREHNRTAPNMLLYWAFIERACALGFQRFNFGRCTAGSGSHRFKLQWGAQDEALYWYHWPEAARLDTPRQDRGSMAMAARLWRHVPVPAANLIGGRLRGGIPA